MRSLATRSIAAPFALALVLGAFAAVGSPAARATPSTTYWTAAATYVQPFGVLHLTYDTYFNRRAAYPIDTGLEIGVLPWQGFQLELGFDLAYPTFANGEPLDLPIALNAKVGAPEDVYFKGCPGWSAGIYGLGFESDVTDLDVVHLEIGKTLPIGTLTVGVYYGPNEVLMRGATGHPDQFGVILGWSSPNIAVPGLDHINFLADVQSGNNALGAAGAGLVLYFTPAVDLVTGPVFFLEEDVQPGRAGFMWTMQLDVDLDLE